MNRQPESSYGIGCFTILLTESAWQAYVNPDRCSDKIKSELLHEYMHYLQDTATYYGTVYRRQVQSDDIDHEIKGGDADELFMWPMMCDYSIVNEKPVVIEPRNGATIILGSLALKESMALESQRYVFGDAVTTDSQAVYYHGIKDCINYFLPFLTYTPLARICIEECCLMTDDPSKSLLIVLDEFKQSDLQQKIDGLTDAELVDVVCNICDDILSSQGLLAYDKIDALDINTDTETINLMNYISGCLYPDEQSLRADEDRFCEIADYINGNRINNLFNRKDNHSCISQALVEYKNSKDMNTLYSHFGMPIIRTQIHGVVHTNKDDFPKSEKTL